MTRTVLITGVSSGIGLALARAYLRDGFHVYGLSRRVPVELQNSERFTFRSVDIGTLATVGPAVENLVAGVDRLDLVILNAGMLGKIADLRDTSLEEIQQVMNVNTWSNKAILDALARRPVQQVVAISSGAATNANRGWNAYAISKAALNMLIALYAAERPETHFSTLAPGIVDTPMQAQIAEVPTDAPFESLEMLRYARGTPMMPRPEEAVDRLVEAITRAAKLQSGSFADINSLVKKSWG